PDLVVYEPVIPVPTSVFWEERTRLGIVARNGIVEFIDARVPVRDRPPGFLTAYLLPEFLNTYGRPTEVWLSTYPAAQGQNDLPFVVVLFYPDQGIAALFSDNGVRQGDMVRGCPQQGPVGFLTLWHPPLNLTFAEVQKGAGVYNVDFLALEESTAMDVSTFYETFKDAENTACLETPAV